LIQAYLPRIALKLVSAETCRQPASSPTTARSRLSGVSSLLEPGNRFLVPLGLLQRIADTSPTGHLILRRFRCLVTENVIFRRRRIATRCMLLAFFR